MESDNILIPEIEQIDENIDDAEKEVIRLRNLRKLAEKDILRRVTLALQNDVGFSSWTDQRFNELKLERYHTYYGDTVQITIPMGYTLFGVVQDLEAKELYVTNISTHDGKFTLLVADEEGRSWMNMERRKLK